MVLSSQTGMLLCWLIFALLMDSNAKGINYVRYLTIVITELEGLYLTIGNMFHDRNAKSMINTIIWSSIVNDIKLKSM